MARPKTTEVDRAFRREVAAKFRAAMKQQQLNQTAAAPKLRISKQALSQDLREKGTPHGEMLARACSIWKIKLRYKDHDFGEGAFQSVAENQAREDILQLDLFQEPQVFKNTRMVVTIMRTKKATLQFSVRIKTPL